MTGFASLTVLETLQNIQNERIGYSPMSVWNDNPPNPVPNEKSPIERQGAASVGEQNAAKKQEYKKKFETELKGLDKELLGIQNYVEKFEGSSWERGRKVQVGTVPQAANDKKDDIRKRINELKQRVALFRKNDTRGMFVYKCVDMEKELDELSNQILSAGYKVPTPESLQNECYFSCMSFNNPSK